MGSQSEFSIYPKQSTFLILTTVHNHNLLVFNALFSVITSNFLRTWKNTRHSYYGLQYDYHIIRKYWKFETYLIQVKRTNRVQLKILEKKMVCQEVYDGPGSMLPIIKPYVMHGNKTEIYSCSSFQCLVEIFTHHMVKASLMYSTVSLPITFTQYIHHESYIQINGSQCYIQPCLIQLHVPNSFQVNATVLQILQQTNKLSDRDCTYGGLVLCR